MQISLLLYCAIIDTVHISLLADFKLDNVNPLFSAAASSM